MKKLLFSLALLTVSVAGVAQDVDNFEVGPYEVEYKGTGDYKFRLRKDVNLYEYFGLKQDTVVKRQIADKPVVKNAWQIGAELGRRMWGFGLEATDVTIMGQYIMSIGKNIYFGAGLSMAYQANKTTGSFEVGGKKVTASSSNPFEANIFEIGVPLTLEIANLRRQSVAPFIELTLTPLYSTTMSQKIVGKHEDLGGSSGMRIDPKLEFGTYIPCGSSTLARIGLFIKKGLSLSTSNPADCDLDYGKRTTRVSIGGNLAILF